MRASHSTASHRRRRVGQHEPWLWPLEIARETTKPTACRLQRGGLANAVRTAVDEFNATATPPTDAVVAFDEQKNAFAVQPEATGTALDVDAVAKAIGSAIASMQPTAKLTADAPQQPPCPPPTRNSKPLPKLRTS
ncbi:MAG: peptidoglycan binding domain-containing protein [Eggerthella lenta]